jgi:small subunit ribosomal protein S4
MGIKKPRKSYERPRKLWDKKRLTEERELMKKYGLKSKKELWKMQTILRKKRKSARELLALEPEEREQRGKELIDSLIRLGVLEKGAGVNDVLNLTIEAILDRRLQSIVVSKGLARTPKQARQLIVHGHIAIGGRKVTSPSYLVPKHEENKIDYADKVIEVKIKAMAKKQEEEPKKR